MKIHLKSKKIIAWKVTREIEQILVDNLIKETSHHANCSKDLSLLFDLNGLIAIRQPINLSINDFAWET
jgi:hypothetical protein